MSIQRDAAFPIENPADGGTYFGAPMRGWDINQLARKIAKISYLVDPRGRTIFNPEGKPVPQIEKDDEAIIAAAAKRCRKVTNVLELLPDRSTRPFVDEEARKKLVSSGECDEAEAARRVPSGTVLSEDLIRQLMEQYMELEVDIDNPKIEPAPVWEGEPATDAERDLRAETERVIADRNAKAKKRKVGMLVAEWFIDELAKLGQAKRQEEQKNS